METKFTKYFWLALFLITISCKDYLNVVPDDVPTVEHAFENRYEAEGFLFGCYSFIPSHADINANPALTGGDEVWLIDVIYGGLNPVLWGIAKGEQGTSSPLANYWSSNHDGSSAQGAKRIFTGLRDCNIFLENIHIPFDMQDWEREQWIAEVKFIKAYLHFWLLRMYGPIPIIKENMPINSSTESVQAYREPVDDVVEYIVRLLDEAAEVLEPEILDMVNDMGRPTSVMALALKAQTLVLAASPLFNGNPDYANIKDNRGVALFPQTYDPAKWEKAAEALKEAIDVCHAAGHELYDYNSSLFARFLNDSTILAMQVRGAMTERWNTEIIWGDANSNPSTLQLHCHPSFYPTDGASNVRMCYAATLKIAEQFYTKNGVPIDEDVEWVGIDKFGLKTGDNVHRYYIRSGYETINLHFNREARFYGALSFDGGTFYGNGRHSSDNNPYYTVMRYPYGNGVFNLDRHSSTGYLVKKLIHYMSSAPETGGNLTTYRYAFPVIRLADLYLMYAEALNEMKNTPDAEVYEYIDMVRQRTGLKGVVESWTTYSTQPGKPLTKEGMREIIRRERLNELAFEGPRFWDLRRWKLAEEYLNQPVQGFSILESTPLEFYKVQTVFNQKFEKKDYLWPIRQGELTSNINLIQNLDW